MTLESELLISYFLSIIAYKTKINKKDLNNKIKKLKEDKLIIEITPVINILQQQLPDIEYYIYPILPKNSLILIGGKPGQFKSMLSLLIATSLKNNDTFLNNFKINNNSIPKILYYDLENNQTIIWWRLQYICNGMKIDINKLNEFDIRYNFNKNNINRELEVCKNYDIIFLDSYRRFLEGTENESEITDRFFKEFLTPLKQQNKTIIILHHFKKKDLEEFSDEDIMDLFRGSTDIPAQFDLIYGIFKSEENENLENNNLSFDVNLVKVKNRMGLPIKNFTFGVEKNDIEKSTIIKFNEFRKRLQSPKERNKQFIIEFLKINPNSKRDVIIKAITEKLLISRDSVIKYLKELLEENEIEQKEYGKYKIADKAQEQEILTIT